MAREHSWVCCEWLHPAVPAGQAAHEQVLSDIKCDALQTLPHKCNVMTHKLVEHTR